VNVKRKKAPAALLQRELLESVGFEEAFI